MIKISVIIPTHNRRQVLERTLPKIFEQDFSPAEFEVIVVMDSCNDGTADLLNSLNPECAYQVLKTQLHCAGAARNVGIRAASGDLILFLDDDLIANPALLRQHCASHFESDQRVVQGRMLFSPESSQTIIRAVLERIGNAYYTNLDPSIDVRFPQQPSSFYVFSYLVNSSIPREALLRSGGFDEQFVAAEELDLGLRLWEMGLSFQYQPDAVVHEYYSKSSSAYLQSQARALGAGQLRAGRKHPAFRPHGGMSTWAEKPATKRRLYKAITSLPISLIPFLSFPLSFEKIYYRFNAFRAFAMRYFGFVETIAILEGALRVAGSWNALEGEFGRKCPSLLYHHIGPQRPGTYRDLTVSPKRFERQIRWLARNGYVGIKPSDWLDWVRSGTNLPTKPVLITFDDAYADTAEFALPILQKYGFKAAVFVVTEGLGGTNTWDEAQGRGTLHLMDREQIRYWSEQGIEFGAHSRTHAHLSDLSHEKLELEIVGSKSDSTALLGHPPASFAYPYGEFNDDVCDLVRREFDVAFSVDEGLNFLSGDLGLLKRAYVGPSDSIIEFALTVLRGGIRNLRNWRIKLALRSRLRRVFGVRPPTS